MGGSVSIQHPLSHEKGISDHALPCDSELSLCLLPFSQVRCTGAASPCVLMNSDENTTSSGYFLIHSTHFGAVLFSSNFQKVFTFNVIPKLLGSSSGG
ncbi:hypothetical protein AVEN_169141-1 [Araneus ventricosus]|uniref:Uncharacterized protein n=1 Tax=Araneus ventricosus TaxID=182803 RepID=A0A4Y2PU41_ARAVE|nr:hypothetical protein AVEN_169141-1 [Araneus ventricosus]